MNILVVDDERIILEMTASLIGAVYESATITAVNSAKEAITASEQLQYDVAFLDIEIPGMSGLELAKKLTQTNEQMNIIFVTAYRQYALEAHDVYASGYVIKPLTKERLIDLMAHLRYPIANNSSLCIQCFGNFEVFYEGEPLHFKRSKAKEMLAYLICLHGATATTMEICSVLWEGVTDPGKQHKYFWAIVTELNRALEECGMEQMLVRRFNSYAIVPSMCQCDYYQYLDGSKDSKNSYRGNFMNQYSWAEVVKAQLDLEQFDNA